MAKPHSATTLATYTDNRNGKSQLRVLWESSLRRFTVSNYGLSIVLDLTLISAPETRKSWALSSPNKPQATTAGTSRAATVDHTHRLPNLQEKVPQKTSNSDPADLESIEHDSSSSEDEFDDEFDDISDKGATAKPNARIIPTKSRTADPFADWDDGEPLTHEQRAQIMALKSNYERSKAVNVIRNARKMDEVGVKDGLGEVLRGAKGVKAQGTKSSLKQKAKSTDKGIARRQVVLVRSYVNFAHQYYFPAMPHHQSLPRRPSLALPANHLMRRMLVI